MEQTQTVEEQAALFLMQAIPVFRVKLRKLQEKNKSEVSRVLLSLIEAPLEQTTRSFTTDLGADLFDLGVRITNSKHILFNSALKIDEVVEEAVKMSVEDSKNEGEQNGS